MRSAGTAADSPSLLVAADSWPMHTVIHENGKAAEDSSALVKEPTTDNKRFRAFFGNVTCLSKMVKQWLMAKKADKYDI